MNWAVSEEEAVYLYEKKNEKERERSLIGAAIVMRKVMTWKIKLALEEKTVRIY